MTTPPPNPIRLDVAELMRNAKQAERAMNRLVKAFDKTAKPQQLTDAEVEAAAAELRKAGYDPRVMRRKP